MINLLSSELYKLRKSKSFRIMVILEILFAWFVEAADVILRSEFAAEGMNRAEYMGRGSTLDVIRQLFANSNAIIYVTIFICIFVLGDYTGGAIKNYVGKGYRREEVYLSKFLVAEFGAVLLYLVAAAAAFAGGIVCYGTEQLGGTFYYEFISYLSMHILYVTGYTAIIVLVCETIRNMAVGILVSVLGVMLISNALVQGVDMVMHHFGVDFSLAKYWIVTIMASCPVTDIPGQFITSSVIAAETWLILSLVLGMLYFSYKDVN